MSVTINPIGSDSVIANTTAIEKYVAAFHPASSRLIANLETKVSTLTINNIQLPMTVNNTEYENSYVCSPYTALIPYTLQEVDKVKSKVFKLLVKSLLPLLGAYLKNNAINKTVYINNWMLSTNLYPKEINHQDVKQISNFLLSKYPQHTLAFRSLTKAHNKTLLRHLEAEGYLLVPSRQVYLYDMNKCNYTTTKDYKKDKKLTSNTSYKFVEQEDILESDIPRIIELYNQLYLQKYSTHNPQFTIEYIRMVLSHENFWLYGYRNEQGVLDAVGGTFLVDNVSSLPIVGYDTNKPIKLGLYRLVVAAAMHRIHDKGQLFHASSGASQFKMFRGAAPEIEYTAIYVNHLPKNIQRMWKIINFLLQKLAVPVMQREQL